MSDSKKLTTSAGAPVADNQNSITAGPRGPLLLQDYQLIEKLAHQNRERIPERPVHAKGWGGHGTLTVTHDITKYTKARIFSYADADRYRLGTHYEALPINAPKCPMNHYHKEGILPFLL